MVRNIFSNPIPGKKKSEIPLTQNIIRTMPTPINIRLPKIEIPKQVKIDFQNQFRQILKEQERGVRRKRYGPL